MEFEAALRAIRTLHDTPLLLRAMGHRPLYEPAPVLSGRASVESVGKVVAVGRTGAFPWFALASAMPERAARGLARRLGQRGRVAGVLALDEQGGRLAIAVGMAGTPSLIIDLTQPSSSALESLSRMSGIREGGALAYAARVADALSIESVGRRFFRAFRDVLERMSAAISGTVRADDRRDFVLLQLTRVLFLYFVQAKGWLAGRERFLAEEADRCLASRKNIHRHLLRPLFFGTLNRQSSERTHAAARFGAVPFLNGGLFEPHSLERRVRRHLPNDAWRDAFDNLFERFHFTTVEAASPGRVAPDMLGRVFEGVMAPDVRRASGTYYTPAALVASIVDAAIVAAVAVRLGCDDSDAKARLDSGHPRAVAVASCLTILDPAVGSGAFLLGALERLASFRVRAGESEAARKRRVLERNLFGVDRSGAAVRLAELRLWLAVIAGDPAERPVSVHPLPNLDCLVRQGDSLLEPSGVAASGRPSPELAGRIGDLRRRVVTAIGQSKRPLVRELETLEVRAARESLEAAEEVVSGRLAECLDAARTRDLFGRRRGIDAELRIRLAEQRAELRGIRSARRMLERNRELPWFHYPSHFPDVFTADGFDIVVGNPPWLRAEGIPRIERERLAGRYRWWRGGGYRNRPDLSVAFVERAFELVRPDGVVAMLVPAKVATASYGASLRHALASTATLVAIADLTGHPDAAFDATVYPLAIVARRSRAPARHRVRSSLASNEPRVEQSSLRGGAPWLLTGSRLRRVLARLSVEHPGFGDSISCHLGVKTGANSVFLDPPHGVEAQLIRRAIRGRDIAAFRVRAPCRLLFPHDANGKPLTALPPAAAAHLSPHLDALRRRADFIGGPPWTLYRVLGATACHRVVWADVARTLTAAALTREQDDDLVPLNSCYVAVAASHAEADRVAAWLNCRWIRVTARVGAVPAAGRFARFAGNTIERLPLPASVLGDERLGHLAVAARDGLQVDDELDDLAAHHLGLSAADRAAFGTMVADGAATRR